MPPPNRFPSSPSLRDLPKQFSGERVSSQSSMSQSKSSRYHVSPCRFTSHRIRPSVASIADIFVGSLVLAGFCNEHAPQRRKLSTVSLRASGPHLQRLRGKDVAGHENRQLATGQRWEHLGSTMQPSRSRSWISTALLPANEDNQSHDLGESPRAKQKGVGCEIAGHRSRSMSDEVFHPHKWPQMLDSILESGNTAGHNKDLSPIALSGNSEVLSASESEAGLSFDERRHRMNSNLYRRILGDDYEWAEPMDVVFPKDQVQAKREEKELPENEVGSHRLSVAKLIHVLHHEKSPSTAYLFRLYRDIPAPGIASLPRKVRGQLLRVFARAPNRRWADARRYLALVQDMIASDKSMSRSMWTSAVHFASRGGGKVLKRDLVRAIGVWQQMEHVAGIEADDVVFNILYDAAIKAGQFTVADRLEHEMTRRNLKFTRFGLVAKIYSAGVRRDLDGISEHFQKFIQAGDLVDTVVLNSLCSAFIRAGDPAAAEQLYSRMIDAQRAKKSPNRSLTTSANRVVFEHSLSSVFSKYRTSSRALGDFLKRSQALMHRSPKHHQALQDSIPMTPDTRTFYIFLRYYARQSGQFDKVAMVLRDMEHAFDVPPNQIVYMMLFEGFAIHGHHKNEWSPERLRHVWHAYLRALRASKARLDAQQRHRVPRKMEWENPLAKAMHLEDELDAAVASSTDEFYTHLPSAGDQTAPDPLAASESTSHDAVDCVVKQNLDMKDGESESSERPNANNTASASHGVPPEITSFSDVDRPVPISLGLQHHDDLDRHLENGVFVGRKMVVVILRAFGACYGPKEVMEAWLQLERLWHPHHRKAADVIAVKEELDKQMSRGPRPAL